MTATVSTITDIRGDPPSRGSHYARLLNQVRQAGLLRRRPAFYATWVAANLLALAAGWTVFLLLGDSGAPAARVVPSSAATTQVLGDSLATASGVRM